MPFIYEFLQKETKVTKVEKSASFFVLFVAFCKNSFRIPYGNSIGSGPAHGFFPCS